MRFGFGSDPKRRWRSERGAVAVEFAILVPVFLLLAWGIADFGHAYYMKQLVSNASREGARYGTKYSTDAGGNHIKPNALNPSIATWITTQYASLLPPDANLTVTPGPSSGGGYTSGTAGQDLSVKVDATKTWWVIGNLMGWGPTATITSTTWMKVE